MPSPIPIINACLIAQLLIVAGAVFYLGFAQSLVRPASVSLPCCMLLRCRPPTRRTKPIAWQNCAQTVPSPLAAMPFAAR